MLYTVYNNYYAKFGTTTLLPIILLFKLIYSSYSMGFLLIISYARWGFNISPKLKAAGRKSCQSYGVRQIWHRVCFRQTETFICFFLLLYSIMTCLVYRFRNMSIPILRSYSIELLIRLLNLINPALPNSIFIMRSLKTVALILTLI